jgi:hypothetical protein
MELQQGLTICKEFNRGGQKSWRKVHPHFKVNKIWALDQWSKEEVKIWPLHSLIKQQLRWRHKFVRTNMVKSGEFLRMTARYYKLPIRANFEETAARGRF